MSIHSGARKAPLRQDQVETPLRIALFSGNYNCVRDGANQALNRLVGHMLHKGADVRVYSPVAPVPAFEPMGRLVPVPSIAIPGRSEYRLATGLTRHVKADLEQFEPHLVHVSAPDLLGRQAQRWAKLRGVPVAASLHTRFETYFQYYGLNILRHWAERHLARFYGDADLILVPNRPIAQEFEATYDSAKIRIWSRGVDPAVFSPTMRDQAWRRQLGYEDSDLIVLFFGRIVREKGLAEFAQAIGIARQRGLRLRPLIVGHGPHAQPFARKLPNANFVGHLSGAALGRAIASADILLNPSTTEAFGNVNLEAMSAGLNVISPRVASATALIDHGRNGWLVDPGDVSAMADVLDILAGNPLLRSQISRGATRRAAAFGWFDTLDEIAAYYRELCFAAPTHHASAGWITPVLDRDSTASPAV